jgi:hypothetical protein
MGNTFMSDYSNLNTERIPTEWRLYHPVSGDEKTVPNDGKLASMYKRIQLIDSGYLLDDTIWLDVEDETDGQ